MLKIAALVWIMLGTVFAGSAVATVLAVPSLSDQAIRYLPLAGVGGYLVAMPFALLIARRLNRKTAA